MVLALALARAVCEDGGIETHRLRLLLSCQMEIQFQKQFSRHFHSTYIQLTQSLKMAIQIHNLI